MRCSGHLGSFDCRNVRCHLCFGHARSGSMLLRTGAFRHTPSTSAPGLGPPLTHLHRDCAPAICLHFFLRVIFCCEWNAMSYSRSKTIVVLQNWVRPQRISPARTCDGPSPSAPSEYQRQRAEQSKANHPACQIALCRLCSCSSCVCTSCGPRTSTPI